MTVVDASAAVEFLLRTRLGKAIERRLFDPHEALHAPHLIDLEIAHVLRRHCAARKLTEQEAREALAVFLGLPVERHPHEPFLLRIWELRNNFTAYDAAYVALAEMLRAPLLTADARLAKSSAARKVAELIQ